MTQHVYKAKSIVTMDPENPRAEAVAVDSGRIVAVGSLDQCTSAVNQAEITDLGDKVLLPGFIDPHSHPMVSGLLTQAPTHWIAPYVGFPTWADVQTEFRRLDKELPEGQPVLFNGLDRLLQEVDELTASDLDEFFANRPAAVLDNSGHEAYFNTATIKLLGWPDQKPPADPQGAHFGRNDDGTSNGRAYETAAIMMALQPLIAVVATHPLQQVAKFYQLMSTNGLTATADLTYESTNHDGYMALASVPHSPLRVWLYQMSIDAEAGAKFESPIPSEKLDKIGIKLWADGSPWVGTIAASFPYLDNDRVRKAAIPIGPGGTEMLNYTPEQLQATLEQHVPEGWQMAFHVNGDLGLDIVLDEYEKALTKFDLLGTDHRWRVEHCGAARPEQFERAAKLGVAVSLAPFQFIYWGDLLDGTLFPPEIGSQWQRFGDAVKSGAKVSFHNDGMVSPPIPLLNIQSAITRKTPSGQLHGPEQIISLDDALKAHTINAAYTLHRDKDLGSIEVGKLADFVELSKDPYEADPDKLTDEVKVTGTFIDGERIDLDAFLAAVQAIDPTEHHDLRRSVKKDCC
ncbi:MAG: amidohydrolase [Candidatus Nanopelagicales bacterium]